MVVEVRCGAGLPCSRCTLGDATEHVLGIQLRGNKGLPVHVLAAHGVAVAEAGAGFREAISCVSDAGLSLASIFAAWARRPLTQIREARLFRSVLRATEGSHTPHLFPSRNAEVSHALEKSLMELFLALRVAEFEFFLIGTRRPVNSGSWPLRRGNMASRLFGLIKQVQRGIV